MGAWEVLTFRVATDATFTDPTIATHSSAAATLAMPGVTIPKDKLDEVHTATRELLDQPLDDIADTEKTIKGTTPLLKIIMAVDGSTITYGSVVPFSREKAEGFLTSLVETGLVVLP